MDKPELKQCPFCGSETKEGASGPVYVADIKDEGYDPLYYVSCLNCGASCGMNEDKQKVIAAWNRRA